MKTTKRVSETTEAQRISAYIILNDKGVMRAKLHSHFSKSGICRTDLQVIGEELQQGKSGGYGYDKFTATLRGMKIDNITLMDHCGTNSESKEILENYKADKITLEEAREQAKKIGANFANWSSDTQKYKSLYFESGLEILKSLGYTVIQAI